MMIHNDIMVSSRRSRSRCSMLRFSLTRYGSFLWNSLVITPGLLTSPLPSPETQWPGSFATRTAPFALTWSNLTCTNDVEHFRPKESAAILFICFILSQPSNKHLYLCKTWLWWFTSWLTSWQPNYQRQRKSICMWRLPEPWVKLIRWPGLEFQFPTKA